MKPIALIEDRAERQAYALTKSGIDLNPYHDVLENTIGKRYEAWLDQLDHSLETLDRYAAVVVHQSAFGAQNTAILHRIIKRCEMRQIPLVIFSGGISVGRYETDPIKRLEINSIDLYSHRLLLLLEHYREYREVELLILRYGQKWQIEILLNIQEKVDRYLMSTTAEDILYSKFENKTDFALLDTLEIDSPKPQIENGWVYRDELHRVAQVLRRLIHEKVYYG